MSQICTRVLVTLFYLLWTLNKYIWKKKIAIRIRRSLPTKGDSGWRRSFLWTNSKILSAWQAMRISSLLRKTYTSTFLWSLQKALQGLKKQVTSRTTVGSLFDSQRQVSAMFIIFIYTLLSNAIKTTFYVHFYLFSEIFPNLTPFGPVSKLFWLHIYKLL